MSAAGNRLVSIPEAAHVSQDLARADLSSLAADTSSEQGHQNSSEDASNKRKALKKSVQVCRYFQTKNGCRAGDTCRYQHVIPANSTKTSSGTLVLPEDKEPPTGEVSQARQDGPTEELAQGREAGRGKSRIFRERTAIAKPVPKSQQTNPREFQITQVVRRFKPTREDVPGGATILSLSITPSDPDFPFELASLHCKLSIPADWPVSKTKPSIKVENVEIPKGYQINIERGFDTIVSNGKTLLALLNDLDRNLERFLSTEKAQTIKIVANRPRREPEVIRIPPEPPLLPAEPVSIPQPKWSQEQRLAAKEKRGADIRQLEARMGRLPYFSASDDKISFTIPFLYPKVARLPLVLQPLKEIILSVPLMYDLEPCSVKLKGVSGSEVGNVEHAFAVYAQDNHNLTLMALVNYLTQHLPDMANTPVSNATDSIREEQVNKTDLQVLQADPVERENGVSSDDRPHLIFLSRPPPEWTRPSDGGETSSDSYSDGDSTEEDERSDSSGDEVTEGGASIPLPVATSNLEKGILFSFPNLEMTGIELLEVRNLSLTVKCDRCKSLFDFRNIKPVDPSSNTSIIRTETCNKCASPLSASYRPELLHANSIKAGYLDIEGCSIQDMLPSTFLPTCSDCSTAQPLPGTTAVRGDTTLIVCRTCHKKMTIHIQEVKFLRVATNDARINRPLAPKRKRENLGITSGTELPERGRCKHYAKSFRWFRFSCCNRVYACDRCHDENEAHPNEHANRMICGWCSREQNYRPEDCHFCQRSVIRKTGGGFWEGGKGTRDRVKMNRNDPRKYKRIGGTTANDKKK